MPTFEGWHLDDDGSPRNGKSVFYRAASDAEPNTNEIETPTVVTDVSGHWVLTTPAGEWDVYLLDGPTVRIWKARTNLPLSFGADQIAVGAGIELTKLDEGTLNEGLTPDGTATNLQERLSDIVSQLKQILGGAYVTHWWEAPWTNLVLAQSHIGAGGSVHGLPTGVAVLGNSQGGGLAGYHFKWGTGTTGGESTFGSPVLYTAQAAVTFSPPFPTDCVGVWATPEPAGPAWAYASAPAVGGTTLIMASPNAGYVAGQVIRWLALGH